MLARRRACPPTADLETKTKREKTTPLVWGRLKCVDESGEYYETADSMSVRHPSNTDLLLLVSGDPKVEGCCLLLALGETEQFCCTRSVSVTELPLYRFRLDAWAKVGRSCPTLARRMALSRTGKISGKTGRFSSNEIGPGGGIFGDSAGPSVTRFRLNAGPKQCCSL